MESDGKKLQGSTERTGRTGRKEGRETNLRKDGRKDRKIIYK